MSTPNLQTTKDHYPPCLESLLKVQDFRIERTRMHRLSDILLIAIFAMFFGVDSCRGIESFGKANLDFLRKMTPLPNGIPSHDTFNRVFQKLPPSNISDAIESVRKDLGNIIKNATIHIDGKVFRGSGTGEGDESCITTAYDGDNDCAVCQRSAVNKKDEHAPAKQFFKSGIFSNCLFTLDAGFCYKGLVCMMIDSKNDYLMGIKGNQKKLLTTIQEHYSGVDEEKPDAITSNEGHGRKEIRKIYKLGDIKFVENIDGFTSIKGIFKVKSTRTTKEKTTLFDRYYITSRDMKAEDALQMIRKHWRIENNHHWVLDTQFNEDQCRSRKGHAAINRSIVRTLAKNMLSIIKKKEKGIVSELGTREKRVFYAFNLDKVLEYLFAEMSV